MVVESRSVIRNAKNARGLGRDRPISSAATVPFPKSCASYFRFAYFCFPTILSESLAQATLKVTWKQLKMVISTWDVEETTGSSIIMNLARVFPLQNVALGQRKLLMLSVNWVERPTDSNEKHKMAINRLGETRVQGRRNSLLFTHHPDNNNILRPITEITRHRKQSISPQKLITTF